MYQVNLKFGNGNISHGFPSVTADFQIRGKTSASITGLLSSNEQLNKAYMLWQSAYKNFCDHLNYSTRMIVEEDDTNDIFSLAHFKFLHKDLKHKFNQWLDSNSFASIRERLIEFINQDNNVRIIICTDDDTLCKLPWNNWNLLERYPNTKLAFSSLDYESIHNHDLTKRKKKREVKILIVLGNSSNIPLTKYDKSLFDGLPNCNCTTLVEPKRRKLDSQLWSESWDVLFFAGHSQTLYQEGIFHLNKDEKLTIEELKYALRKSIFSGLQLAIFNSCDGLGLASDLAKLSLPFSVIMREPIPDVIAHKFLKFFLDSFSQGENIHSAVKIAQQQLQGHESEFPFLTSLPLIYQNINAPSLTWKYLKNKQSKSVSIIDNIEKIIIFARNNKRKIQFTGLSLLAILFVIIIASFQYNNKLNEYNKAVSSGSKNYILSDLSHNEIYNLTSSEGDKFFIQSDNNPRLKKGVEDFAHKKYIDSAKQFHMAWRTNRSNPEALIYYNNSLSLQRDSYYTLAIVVPVKANPGNAKEMLMGVAMAQEEYNQTAKDDEPLLRIIITNDNNDYKQARQVAEVLARKKDILGVIGHNSSSATEAAIVEYKKKNLPVISPTSSSISLESPIFFRTVPSDYYQAQQIADLTKSIKSENVAIFYNPHSRYSKDLSDSFEKIFHKNIVKIYDLSNLNFDFSIELANLAYKGIADTAIIIPSVINTPVAIELIQANAKLAPEDQLNLIGSSSFYNAEVLQRGGDALKNITITGIPWDSTTPEAKNFLEAGSQLWNEQVNWRTATSYDATKTFLKVLTPNISRDQVLKSLRDVQLNPNETSGRSIEFDKDGNITNKPVTLEY